MCRRGLRNVGSAYMAMMMTKKRRPIDVDYSAEVEQQVADHVSEVAQSLINYRVEHELHPESMLHILGVAMATTMVANLAGPDKFEAAVEGLVTEFRRLAEHARETQWMLNVDTVGMC